MSDPTAATPSAGGAGDGGGTGVPTCPAADAPGPDRAASATLGGSGGGAVSPLARAPSATPSAADAPEERYEGLDNPSIVVDSSTPLIKVPVISLRPTQLAVGAYSVGLKADKVARKRAKGAAALDAWLRAHPVPCVRGPPHQTAAAASEGDNTGSSGQQQQQQGAAAGAAPDARADAASAPLYLIDHHHLASALHRVGVDECYAAVVRDYSSPPADAAADVGASPAAAAAAAAAATATAADEAATTTTPEHSGFWAAMRRDGCLWPHDEHGRPVAWADLPSRLPSSVAGLRDDPYRSLAGLVRRAGGFEKSGRPFAEFVWANHLRTRVHLPVLRAAGAGAPAPADGKEGGGPGGGGGGDKNKESGKELDVSAFVPAALEHAKDRDAEGLPGFTPGEEAGPGA